MGKVFYTTLTAACALCALCAVFAFEAFAADTRYPWLERYDPENSLEKRIAPPPGFERASAEKGSFGEWLRGLPLFEGRPEVMLFDGKPKANQAAHHAVFAVDCGTRDLMQCADAVMRLRAEYLYSQGRTAEISFRLTCGKDFAYGKWKAGYYPVFESGRLGWAKRKKVSPGYEDFKKYLEYVYIYANTYSLDLQMKKTPPKDIAAGDVFIKGGFPGHAVMVVDVARDVKSGGKVFLIAQSYMPAQQIHLLVNPSDPALSPWYDAGAADGVLITPEWTFESGSLKRF